MPRTLCLYAADPDDIRQAANLLRAGGTVAFPTETVYGLGANALDAEAVGRIFKAKQRPLWDPLIVHVPDAHSAWTLILAGGELRRRADALARSCWPGPLTLLLPRRAHIPDAVTASRPLVGVRVPAHPAAQALLRAARVPLAAPSANRFGHTSPTTARHVLDDLDGRIDAVLDDGATQVGVESSVLDPGTTPMTLYRPGAFTPDMLQRATGVEVTTYEPEAASAPHVPEPQGSLPAPGVGLRHYAPHARLVLTPGTPEALQHAVAEGTASGQRTGVLLPAMWEMRVREAEVEPWAEWNRPEHLAAELFRALRALDGRGVSRIYCPLPEAGGLCDAIRDRLQKAAREA